MRDEEIEKIVNQSLGLTSDSESVVATKTNDTYLQSKNEESNSNEDIRSLSALLDKELGLDKYEHKTPRQPVSEMQTSESVDDKIQDLQNKLRELMALKNQKEQNQSRKVDVRTDNGNTNVVVNMPQNNDTQTHFNLVCETCGSTDIRMVNNSLGVCGHCGANVVIKKPTENSSVINIYNNGAKSDSDDDNDSIEIEPKYYLLKPKYSQKEFQRNMMIYLSSLHNTPADITNSEFEVKTEYVTFMFSEYHVTGSYSVSIGYDRQEQYEENDYWHPGHRVLSERTVTDWQPYNRDVSENQKTFVKISKQDVAEEPDEFTFRGVVNFYKIQERDYEELKDGESNINLQEPSENDEKNTRYKIWESIVENSPGDLKRIVDCNDNFSYKLINRYFIVVPKYVLYFKYNNINYKQSAFASFKFAPIGLYKTDYSQKDIKDIPITAESDFYKKNELIFQWDEEKCYPKYDVDTEIKKLCIKHGMFSVLLSLLAMSMAIIMPFLHIKYYSLHYFIFCFGGSAMLIIPPIGYFLYKLMCKITELVFCRKLLNKKQSNLENYLMINQMESLNQEEIKLFKNKEGK